LKTAVQYLKINTELRFCIAVLFCLFTAASIQSKSLEEKSKIIVGAISQKYEFQLPNLDPSIKKHYAVRKYRITGDSSYIPFIIEDLNITLTTLQNDSQHFSDSIYISQREQELFEKMNQKTRKGKLRRALFKDNRKMLFYLNFLYNTNTIADYNLDKSISKNLLESCLLQLKQIDYHTFLTDTTTLRVYAAQAVNYVYYLQQLKITDFRDDYINVFQQIFPDSLDSKLSNKEFRDKIYGLTHFIISASRYYQEPVDSIRFKWIFQYFDKNIKKILKKCTPDIIAEVGICYKLAGYQNHKPLLRCIKKVIKSFNKKHSMILSPKGNSDISKGEHRNILAIMLLSWGDSLYQGPDLSHYQE
jgi:hypothetical protein